MSSKWFDRKFSVNDRFYNHIFCDKIYFDSAEKGLTLYFSVLKIFCRPKTEFKKILIIFCAIVPLKILEYFCELLGFYCITENVGIYLNAFQLIFDDSKTCQVYGLTYFLSMKYYKITSSVTKSTLTLQKKVQFSIFLYIKIFYSTFY